MPFQREGFLPALYRRVLRGFAQRPDFGAGTERLLLADLLQHGFHSRFTQFLRAERQRTHQQLVQNHAQRIHIRAGVNVALVAVGLLRAHVVGRAHHPSHFGEHRDLGKPLPYGLGQPEVDDLGYGLFIHLFDQDIGWLQVAVDDGLLMGVLNPFTDLHEQLQALLNR